ncbi:DJ-1/PfpI/YhbO family deglycase/protease [Clostridium bovifaecis]|uniref:DJ-1/PfpI/YhbO family deglycase/protease n=1 Tax=Clostridium bovifaecis TaxID=2184719 RepID=A0A6I6ERC0_9CLOT|nr:DJ-1/PfpI/YhbO family deglycase/protease [Clostridium bovifaecis]
MTTNKKVVSLIHNDFEDLELWYPILRLREEGVEVVVAGEKAGEKYVGKYGVPAYSDCAFKDIKAEEFDGILIPGGWAPDRLRRFPEVIELVQKMNEENKVIGQICHAGWVSISAKILKGKNVTSTPGIKDDMENAGAIWLNEPVVVDKNIVSSRRPMDLPMYMQKYIETLK